MAKTVRDSAEELLVEEELCCHVPATQLRSTCKIWDLLFKAPKEVKVKAIMLSKDRSVCPVRLSLHDGSVPSLEVKTELSLVDPLSHHSDQFDLSQVIHCDSLLQGPVLIIWNPCTGQTKWINDGCSDSVATLVLGFSGSSSTKSYKVLCFSPGLDQDLSQFNWSHCEHAVSVKREAPDGESASTYLVSFDFDSEKASLPLRFPYQPCTLETLSLSPLGEDNEFWVTNKIFDETSPVSTASRTTLRDLPEELVEEEILSRVPATHLKRLRSTCKRWNLLFNQRRFARQHSVKAPKEVKALMLTADNRVCPLSLNLHGDGPVPSLEVQTELSLVDPDSNAGAQFDLSDVMHCDGFLVSTTNNLSRVVIWNPCTGQTKWIKDGSDTPATFVLGYYYQDSIKRYKVLCLPASHTRESRIYDFSSDSWRILDQDLSLFARYPCERIVSVKGKAYWITHVKTYSKYLVSFDFDSEKASLPLRLPHEKSPFACLSLSVVGEDKLAVLMRRSFTSKTEFWVTNKILDETTPVSWSLVFALDFNRDIYLKMSSHGSFLLDEEKKLALCCERQYAVDPEDDNICVDQVYYLGGDDFDFTQVYSRFDTMDSYGAAILNYVPSLAQIEPIDGGYKRRRTDY